MPDKPTLHPHERWQVNPIGKSELSTISAPHPDGGGFNVVNECLTIYARQIVRDHNLMLELLKALQNFADAFGHYCEGEASDDEIAALMEARAIFTKATGGVL